MSELVRVMSDAHRELIRLLQNWGVGLMEEVEFPPYTVDIYVPDAHVAIEADGPHHSRRHDDKRDQQLYERYSLVVLRVQNELLSHPDKLRVGLQEAFAQCTGDITARLTRCRNILPWI
jgi:very-short-patch-repair endonuclease